MAGVGDMNGDGYPDVAISVMFSGGEVVYVVYGRKRAMIADISLSSVRGDGVNGFRVYGERGYYTGLSISGVGDVNEDHAEDLVIGALSSSSPSHRTSL